MNHALCGNFAPQKAARERFFTFLMSDLVVMKNLTVCLMELETSLEKSCMIDKNEATTYLVVMDMLGAVQSLETSHAIGASELDDWVEVVLRVVIRGEGTRHAIGASELVVCSPVIAAADELCDGIKLFALEVTVVEVLRGSIYMWDMGKIKAKQRFNVIMWWGPGRGHPEIKYPGYEGLFRGGSVLQGGLLLGRVLRVRLLGAQQGCSTLSSHVFAARGSLECCDWLAGWKERRAARGAQSWPSGRQLLKLSYN